jgi:RNA polymerase sigma-70 factor (ECF subfamily)
MVSMSETEHHRTDEDLVLAATVRAGTDAAFAESIEPFRRELRVHCYRMVGSFDEAEDLVQDTFTKAWRHRTGFEGRSSLRAWLYRIATNTCLDAIKAHRRRPVAAATGNTNDPTLDEVPWLQPFPDDLIDHSADVGADPAEVVVARETIALGFLATMQHLAPRPRAAVILRDVLGWSPSEIADALDGSVAAVNSALQRGRARLHELGRPGRLAWTPVQPPTDEERSMLQRYMDAHARSDAGAVIALLGPDVRFSMPPELARFEGRDAVADFFRDVLGAASPGEWRLVPTRANGQPAAANYVRRPGEQDFVAITFDVLRFERGTLVEITTFGADVFASFGLPTILDNPVG